MQIKLILFPLLILCSFYLHAQSWHSQLSRFDTFFNQGNLDSTLIIGEELLKFDDNPQDTSTARVLGSLAYFYFHSNEFEKAHNYGEHDFELRSRLGDTLSYEFAETVYYLAIYNSYLNNPKRASDLLRTVHNLYEKKLKVDALTFINVKLQLANMLAESEQIESADHYYTNLYLMADSLYAPLDSNKLAIHNTISQFYVTHGMFQKAEPYYLEAVDMMKSELGEENQYHLISLNSLGQFYVYAGQYKKAQKIFESCIKLSAKIFGKASADYATALNNYAVTLDYTNQSFLAIEIYKEVIAIKEKVFKTESDYYALSLLNLGVAYSSIQHLINAEQFVGKSIKIYSRLDGDESKYNYGLALSQYAAIKRNLGQLDSARYYEKKALNIQEEIYGKNHQGYYSALTSFSQTLIDAGDYKGAKTHLLECAEIQEKLVGKSHPDYGKTALYLAQVESELGNVGNAYLHAQIAIDIFKKAFGEKSAEYGRAINTKANIEFQNMDFSTCKKSYDTAQRLFKSIYGDTHLEYATIISNKALFLTAIGEYKEALGLLEKALSINQLNLESQPFSAASGMVYILSNMSAAYMAMNDFTNAEKALIEASNLAEDKLGTNHPDFARILGNRGKIYGEIGVMEKAIVYYDSSISILKYTYGEKSVAVAGMMNNKASVFLYKAQDSKMEYQKALAYADSATYLLIEAIAIVRKNRLNKDLSAEYNNLAEAYRVMNRNDSAIYYYDLSIQQEQKFGKNESSIAITLHNKAMSFLALGDTKTAEKMANESIKIKTKYFGDNHSSLKGAYLSLSQIQLANSDLDAAKKSLFKCLDIYENELVKSFTYFSESEKLAWLQSNSVQEELLKRMAFAYQNELPEITERFTTLSLTQSAMLLRSSEAIRTTAAKNNEAFQIYEAWLNEKKALGILSSSLADTDPRVQEKTESANQLEKQLSDLLGAAMIKNKPFDLTKFKYTLKQNELYVHFLEFSAPSSTHMNSYFALVIDGNDKTVKVMKLCDESQLEILIDKNASTRKKGVDKLYGIVSHLNVQLGGLLLDKILQEHPGVEHFYYTPTALLHQISFDAIPKSSTEFYSDSILFHRVNDPNTYFEDREQLTLDYFELIGGVDYGNDGDWKYLKGTKTEVEEIDKVLKTHDKKDGLLMGSNASHSKLFNDISENHPDVIHIATHGFFYPDPSSLNFEEEELAEELTFRGSKTSQYALNKDPMMRSGIVLANANSSNKLDEGILSAYDISLKDLSNTSLVVLSACETGLGDVTGSEGVYGLQRAFRLAGVKNMIMSLWQVPDKETSEFMIHFYTQLCELNNIQNAFHAAQTIMKSHYDPYFWAAFILIQ